MLLEEFIKSGCVQCGGHEFTSTGPIEVDGFTEVTCCDCGTSYDRDRIGEYDSFSWEQESNHNQGLERPEPISEIHYHNEEQFKEENIRRGFTPSDSERFVRDFEKNVES